MSERIWECKIGGEVGEIPPGGDLPMRNAVARAYRDLTGVDAEFHFSGWAGTLDEHEREVVEEIKARA